MLEHSFFILIEDVDAFKVLGGRAEALGHDFLGRSKGHAGIVVFLVRFLRAFGIAYLSLQVGAVLGLVGSNACEEERWRWKCETSNTTTPNPILHPHELSRKTHHPKMPTAYLYQCSS
jgi:hypothetical protein